MLFIFRCVFGHCLAQFQQNKVQMQMSQVVTEILETFMLSFLQGEGNLRPVLPYVSVHQVNIFAFE